MQRARYYFFSLALAGFLAVVPSLSFSETCPNLLRNTDYTETMASQGWAVLPLGSTLYGPLRFISAQITLVPHQSQGLTISCRYESEAYLVKHGVFAVAPQGWNIYQDLARGAIAECSNAPQSCSFKKLS